MPDGSPAFPQKVIGTWTCDGYHVGDDFRTQEGTVVVTRPVIAFDNGDLLITQGSKLAETDVAIIRAVTGDCADAPAEIRQTLLGMSDGYGVRLQTEFNETTAWISPAPHPDEVAERLRRPARPSKRGGA